jgi:hypothetical protein
MSAPSKVVNHPAHLELDIDAPPRIPEGEYRLKYLRHKVFSFKGQGWKLAVVFAVLELGEHFGIEVAAFYNLQRPRTKGRIAAKHCSRLVRELASVLGSRFRRDRLPVSSLAAHVLVGRVRTVSYGEGKRPLHDDLKYSVVDALTGCDE